MLISLVVEVQVLAICFSLITMVVVVPVPANSIHLLTIFVEVLIPANSISLLTMVVLVLVPTNSISLLIMVFRYGYRPIPSEIDTAELGLLRSQPPHSSLLSLGVVYLHSYNRNHLKNSKPSWHNLPWFL
jgi:hypothetical protein